MIVSSKIPGIINPWIVKSFAKMIPQWSTTQRFSTIYVKIYGFIMSIRRFSIVFQIWFASFWWSKPWAMAHTSFHIPRSMGCKPLSKWEGSNKSSNIWVNQLVKDIPILSCLSPCFCEYMEVSFQNKVPPKLCLFFRDVNYKATTLGEPHVTKPPREPSRLKAQRTTWHCLPLFTTSLCSFPGCSPGRRPKWCFWKWWEYNAGPARWSR